MALRIKLKINVVKLLKEYFFRGKNGVYVDIVGFDKPDQYGNDGYLQQDLPREERDKGVKPAFCGNFKIMGPKPAGAPGGAPAAPPPSDENVGW